MGDIFKNIKPQSAKAKTIKEKPTVIIAKTIKGKGVSYMENRMEWHYLPMKPEQFEMAINDVNNNYI